MEYIFSAIKVHTVYLIERCLEQTEQHSIECLAELFTHIQAFLSQL